MALEISEAKCGDRGQIYISVKDMYYCKDAMKDDLKCIVNGAIYVKYGGNREEQKGQEIIG